MEAVRKINFGPHLVQATWFNVQSMISKTDEFSNFSILQSFNFLEPNIIL
jgi:hypothetical protein